MSDSANESPAFPFAAAVTDIDAGKRLDAWLVAQFPQFSRSHLQRAIEAGLVLVGGERRKTAYKLLVGELVEVQSIDAPRPGPTPQAIPLSILYEDDDLVAVDKPPGMVVHPAKGHWEGTLASALAHHFGSQLSSTGGPTRPGIVHRLDRDTSGVLVVAKHDQAHDRLAAQFKDRTVEKEYWCIVHNVPDRDADVIDAPIGAHPHQRERMAIRADHPTSRPALTKYEVIERFPRFALVRALPKTGRTHQIRVHLTYAGYPILCDRLYGARAAQVTARELASNGDETVLLTRQALHAHRLKVTQPRTGAPLEFIAPLPSDMIAVIHCLRSGEAAVR
jgi:23S rRNA pseudouridine1911/1915/1917 synthase